MHSTKVPLTILKTSKARCLFIREAHYQKESDEYRLALRVFTDQRPLNDERRNRVYEQNLFGMAKLINLFTVGKKWCRKTVSRQLIPCQSISSFP